MALEVWLVAGALVVAAVMGVLVANYVDWLRNPPKWSVPRKSFVDARREIVRQNKRQLFPTVTHPDGKVFYRNSADQWMPL